MATAEEVLQTMAETYAETDKILTIDNDLRTITIPPGITNIGVESDDGVHRLHFRMPRQYGEFDLSEFDIRINYLNANNEGDKYAVLDKSAEEDYIDFSWLVGRHALAYRGNVTFIVCLRKSDGDTVEKEFNTTVAALPVLEGLETTEQVTQEYPDALEEILRRLDDLEENGGSGAGTPGEDGVGIQKIEKTNTEGLVDTYTITLTDSSTYTFTVTNGKDGEDADGNYLTLSGGTMAGNLLMGGYEISDAIDIEANNSVSGKYLKTLKRDETGLVTDVVILNISEPGILSIASNTRSDGGVNVILRGLDDPVENDDAATKIYVDTNTLSLEDLKLQEFSELNTTSKTIIGAINELLEKINALTPDDNEALLTISK